MEIAITLDIMLVRRNVASRKLAATIGISETNLSLIKSGKAKGVRFSSLNAIWALLDCQPSDTLEFESDKEDNI